MVFVGWFVVFVDGYYDGFSVGVEFYKVCRF